MSVEEIVILAGSSSRRLTASICEHLGVSPGQGEVITFSEGNTFVRVMENVRGREVYIVQSTIFPANDSFMELLFWIDAFKRAQIGHSSMARFFPQPDIATAPRHLTRPGLKIVRHEHMIAAGRQLDCMQIEGMSVDCQALGTVQQHHRRAVGGAGGLVEQAPDSLGITDELSVPARGPLRHIVGTARRSGGRLGGGLTGAEQRGGGNSGGEGEVRKACHWVKPYCE